MYELGDTQVESRIVDEDYHVGCPSHDVFLALRHVAQYGTGMEQYGDEAHVGQVFVVPERLTAFGRHHVSTDKTEGGLSILLFKAVHQPAGMQVAGSLACYEIVFHVFCLSRFIIF